MNHRRPSPKRRQDLAAALKRVKAEDVLTLEELALLWGVTKPRFVSERNLMATFPDHIKQGNVYFYPAKAAIQAMLDHETRHDKMNRDRAAIAARILGKGRQEEVDSAGHSVNELATLNRMATEMEEREREQGKYIPAAEVARVCGEVFSEISEFMSSLDAKVDPNGLLPLEIRAMILSNGKDALLRLHRLMRDMLRADADDKPTRTAARRSRRASARR